MRVFQKVVAGGGGGGGRIVGTDGVKRHTADAKFFFFFFTSWPPSRHCLFGITFSLFIFHFWLGIKELYYRMIHKCVTCASAPLLCGYGRENQLFPTHRRTHFIRAAGMGAYIIILFVTWITRTQVMNYVNLLVSYISNAHVVCVSFLLLLLMFFFCFLFLS